MWEDGGGGVGDRTAVVVDGGAVAAEPAAVTEERERERERGPAIGSLYGLPAREAVVVREGRRSCIGSVERRGEEPYKCQATRHIRPSAIAKDASGTQPSPRPLAPLPGPGNPTRRCSKQTAHPLSLPRAFRISTVAAGIKRFPSFLHPRN